MGTYIPGYTYNTENYCPDCVITKLSGVPQITIGYVYDVEAVLNVIAGAMDINRMDEQSFDSATFPKAIFDYQLEDDEQCGSCNDKLR